MAFVFAVIFAGEGDLAGSARAVAGAAKYRLGYSRL